MRRERELFGRRVAGGVPSPRAATTHRGIVIVPAAEPSCDARPRTIDPRVSRDAHARRRNAPRSSTPRIPSRAVGLRAPDFHQGPGPLLPRARGARAHAGGDELDRGVGAGDLAGPARPGGPFTFRTRPERPSPAPRLRLSVDPPRGPECPFRRFAAFTRPGPPFKFARADPGASRRQFRNPGWSG